MPTTSDNSQPTPDSPALKSAVGVGAVADPRRSEFRFSLPDSTDIVLWTGQPATIADESFSGIALYVQSGAMAKVGREVCVDYQGRAAAAIVRCVQQEEPERWRVGLEWKEPGGPFKGK